MEIGKVDNTPGIQEIFARLNAIPNVNLILAQEEILDFLEPLTVYYHFNDDVNGISVTYRYKETGETFKGSISHRPYSWMPSCVHDAEPKIS